MQLAYNWNLIKYFYGIIFLNEIIRQIRHNFYFVFIQEALNEKINQTSYSSIHIFGKNKKGSNKFLF